MARLSSTKQTLIVIFACIGFAAFSSPATADGHTGEISVRITGTETRRPLGGIAVTIAPRNGQPKTAKTSADGSVLFENLEPGLYSLTAEGERVVTAYEPSLRVVTRKATPVRLEMVTRDSAIDEVVVTARARQADLYGSAGASYLNREELRSAVGAGSDVMRALDGLPGLISTGDFANFSVRGRGPRDNLILVDGLPFDKVVHFDQTLGEEEDIGGGGRFSVFAPNSIGGAEFSPGGWGAAYGGRAGSLLQLNVAKGNVTPTANLRLDLAGIEMGYDGPSGFHDDTTVLFSARRFDFGQLFDFIDELDIGEPVLTDILLKSVTQLDSANTIEFLALYAPEEFERDITHVVESPDFEDVALLTTDQDNELFGLTWRRLVGDTGEWANRFYYRNSDKTSSEGEAFPDLAADGAAAADIPVRENIITIGEKEQEIGWRSDFTASNRFGLFSTGLRLTQIDVDFFTELNGDWSRFVYDQNDFRQPGQNFVVLTPESTNSSYAENEVSYAFYGEQVFKFDEWNIRTGLRYDRDGFSGEDLLSPRFAVNWSYSPRLRLSGTAGIYYQSPRYLDRARDDSNANLENERIAHVSLGADYDIDDRWNLLLEAYYQDLDKLVVEQDRTNGTINNAGDGRSYGFDTVLSRSFGNGWSGIATYSYNDVQLNDNNGAGDYTADFSREHFFSVSGIWEISDRWKVAARWKYASGRPTDDFIVNSDVLGPEQPLRFSKELTRQNALKLDDYHSLNLRIDYRRPIGPVDFVGFLDVINVYSGPNTNSVEWDPRRGVNVVEEGDAFPLVGIIFERTW